jgi:hypothetical protein
VFAFFHIHILDMPLLARFKYKSKHMYCFCFAHVIMFVHSKITAPTQHISVKLLRKHALSLSYIYTYIYIYMKPNQKEWDGRGM